MVSKIFSYCWNYFYQGWKKYSRFLKICFAVVFLLTILIYLLVLWHILSFQKVPDLFPAPAVIVFGAGVLPNGSPSDALSDRTVSACRLYQSGIVRFLVFSGGYNRNVPCSEPEAMKKIALSMGIPSNAIILDEQGINTLASIRRAKIFCEQYSWDTVYMLSHGYHLARIALLSNQENIKMIPLPCKESYVLTAKPYFIAREVIAWIYYYCQGLTL